MNTNIILAAGQSSRWDGIHPKQMTVIKGQPLLERICRNVSNPIIVALNQLGDEIKSFGAILFRPEKHSMTCETVLSSQEMWGDGRVVIWLGDVYYTSYAFDLISNCSSPLMFFGDGVDIFAISFTDRARFTDALQKAISNGGNGGRLWEAYRALYGLPVWPLTASVQDSYTMIRDDTTDFDTVSKTMTWDKSLDEIAKANKTNKATTHHGYTTVYERIFRGWRNHPFTMVEFGVQFGCSIRTWLEYFHNASVIGVDRLKELDCGNPRYRHIQCDQADVAVLDRELLGPFRIVIDDASHLADSAKATFNNMWSKVEPGGVYIIEDTFTYYHESFKSSVDGHLWLADFVRAVNLDGKSFHGNPKYQLGYGPDVKFTPLESSIDHIEASIGLFIIFKKP